MCAHTHAEALALVSTASTQTEPPQDEFSV